MNRCAAIIVLVLACLAAQAFAVCTITTTTLPGGTVNQAYSQALNSSGCGIISSINGWTIDSGTVPTGLTVNHTAPVWRLSGIPTTTVGSPFNFTLRVTGSMGTATQAYSVAIVTGTITITNGSLPNGIVGSPYSAQITVSGGQAPYTYSVTAGTLPTGLSLNASTGLISGTPTTTTGSPFTFTIHVTDTFGDTPASQPFTVTVTNPDNTYPVPTPPQVYVVTTYSLPVGGTTWHAHNASDLTTALAGFSPGDVIILDAGTVYSGNFVVPFKSNPGNKWTYIQSSAYGSLPGSGVRVGPGDAGNMPKIVTPNTTAAISICSSANSPCSAGGTNYIRFVGIEVYSASTVGGGGCTNQLCNNWSYYLLQAVSADDSTTPPPANNITIDRCYIHGSPTVDVIHAIGGNATYFEVTDSYISDSHKTGNDAQSILAYYTPGPIRINNNFISASTEDMMFGGAGACFYPSCPGPSGIDNPYVVSDLQITNNHFFKPLSWFSCGDGGTVPPGSALANGTVCPSGISAVTAASWSSGTATLTLAGIDNFTAANVVIAGVTPSGYNGTYAVTSGGACSPTAQSCTISYALVSNPGSYTSGGTVQVAVTAGSWSAGTATLSIANAFTNYPAGSQIVISGVTPSGYNGTVYLTNRTASTISYAVVSNPGAYSSGGTVVAEANQWVVKDNLEFKVGRRAVVTGNTLENSWKGGQQGFSLVLTPRSGQTGNSTVVNDILFQGNTITNTTSGVNTLEQDDNCGPPAYPYCANKGQALRDQIQNNLILLAPSLDAGHKGFLIDGGINGAPGLTDYIIGHNTVLISDNSTPSNYYSIYFSLPQGLGCSPPSPTHNLWILNNAFTQQPTGDCSWQGTTGLNIYMPDYPPLSSRYTGNVMFCPSGSCAAWPANNDATTTPFVYVAPPSNYQLQTPNWTCCTTDGNQAGYNSTSSPVTVTTDSCPNGTVGGAGYACQLSASGGTGIYTWSITSGTLPAGLALSSSTGLISGTPTTQGTQTFVAQACDTNSSCGHATLSITIATLTIVTSSLPNGITGQAYSTTLVGAGGTLPYTWSVSAGSLPTGLSLNASAGVISGVPTIVGMSNFTIQLTDAEPVSTQKAFTLTITAVYPIFPTNLAGTTALTGNAKLGSR